MRALIIDRPVLPPIPALRIRVSVRRRRGPAPIPREDIGVSASASDIELWWDLESGLNDEVRTLPMLQRLNGSLELALELELELAARAGTGWQLSRGSAAFKICHHLGRFTGGGFTGVLFTPTRCSQA